VTTLHSDEMLNRFGHAVAPPRGRRPATKNVAHHFDCRTESQNTNFTFMARVVALLLLGQPRKLDLRLAYSSAFFGVTRHGRGPVASLLF